MIARVRSSPETIIISFLFLVEAMPLLALETISSSFVSLLLSMSVLDSCACCFLGCWSSSQEQRPSPARCRNLEPSRERRLYYSSWTNVEAKSRATTLQQSGPVAPKCTCLLAHSTLGIEDILKDARESLAMLCWCNRDEVVTFRHDSLGPTIHIHTVGSVAFRVVSIHFVFVSNIVA
jgi:hypothetical protein